MFTMPCPVCEEDVEDIEGTFTEGSRTECFWGAPVFVDESEFELEVVPACRHCGKVTITDDAALEWFWDREAV